MNWFGKAIVSILLLAAFAASAFFIGWIEFRLEAGEYAILSSKTSGIDPKLFQYSDISWRWELLIPRNTNLFIFEDHPRSHHISHSVALPSAALYSQYAASSPSFLIELEAEAYYSLRFNPDSFVKENKFPTSDYIDAMNAKFITELHEIFTQQMVNAVEDPTTLGSLVEAEVERSAPDSIVDFHVHIITLLIPDYEVYEAAKETYLDVQQSLRSVLVETQTAETLATKSLDDDIHRLEAYARLFESHPVLLDYISESTGDPARIFQAP